MTENESGDRLTPRRVLGNHLRELREAAGLSLRQLAEITTYGHTYLGRVELGQQLPSDALIEALGDRLGGGQLLMQLLELARQGSIQEYGRKTAQKEAQAIRIQVSTSSLIPGLLQTPDYTRALYTASRPRTPAEEIEEDVAARVARQKIFGRGSNSPIFWAILDESALKRTVGDAKCMSEQLDFLLQMKASRDVTIQVYPFERGDHPMLEGSLTLLTMADGETLAYLESFGSGELVESPKRVTSLTQRFDTAKANALPERESLTLVHKYLKEHQA